MNLISVRYKKPLNSTGTAGKVEWIKRSTSLDKVSRHTGHKENEQQSGLAW